YFIHDTGAEDVADLLRGEVAVLKAAKKGGYNNIEVARFLLENGAEVNAQDRGGLIALHNASSYGHLEIAALLIEHGASVNQPDKWGFTPLHEAAQKVFPVIFVSVLLYHGRDLNLKFKGRTQICSLLLSHGANVYLETHEGQLPIDLATAADTKQLLKVILLLSAVNVAF
uniref:Tankyrase n=1 Tax=Parascaris equorum TaxID=6256 RepID=A0A914R6X5_PAREQ